MKKLQLLVLLAILMPVRTMADHIEDTYLYMVNMVGVDQLDFEMPVFDVEGYDGWVDDGYVYVTPEGGSKQTLLKYRSYEGDADDYGEATVSKGVDGLLILHRKRGYSDVVVTTSSTKYKIPFESGLDYGKLYLSWKVPENMRGKKLTVMLQWYDILNEQSNFSRTVNANGWRDQEVNAITSYAMLHVSYRLNLFGGDNNRGGRGRWGNGPRGGFGGGPGGAPGGFPLGGFGM